MNEILAQTLADISNLRDISSLSLVELHVCSPFVVVKLNDGSVGSAGNYDVQNKTPGYDSARAKSDFLRRVADDPLLFETSLQDKSLAALSLRTAILSALSQPLLNSDVLCNVGLFHRPAEYQEGLLESYLREGDTAVLIGYGGGLYELCSSHKVSRLYVCDLLFSKQRHRDLAWRRLRGISKDLSRISLTHRASEVPFERAGLCFITGSALCNGTMEELLRLARHCREVIVQGPSCSLLPLELFRRGRPWFSRPERPPWNWTPRNGATSPICRDSKWSKGD